MSFSKANDFEKSEMHTVSYIVKVSFVEVSLMYAQRHDNNVHYSPILQVKRTEACEGNHLRDISVHV